MTDQTRASNDYGISTSPLNHTVRAYCNGEVLAASPKAIVMYETRLAPTVYFPIEDVCVPLSQATDHRTFCPFKGTATYFDLKLRSGNFENSAWSYARALPESEAVEGHIAFMPSVLTHLEHEDGTLVEMDSGNIAGPIVDWIMREAWLCASPEELTAAFVRKLRDHGVEISRMSVMIWSLHPMIAGKNYVWTKDDDRVKSYTASHGILDDPAFVNSPLRHVSKGLGGVRQRLDGSEIEFDFPIIEDLRSQGATDYVAMPLPFSNGQINVLTLSCDHPNGFTTPNLGLVFECSSVISRYYEVFTLKENSEALLETYLGKRTGSRVLGGEIRRGDGDVIEAAILFCDMRDSTLLEEKLGRSDYINLLNSFFDKLDEIITQHEGEVLKFIGDAVLAIFPSGSDKARACENALNSARAIVGEFCGGDAEQDGSGVDCAIGIAYGEVTYGNIGSRGRLDFTVIGATANIAARLGDHGKICGRRIIMSPDIVANTTECIALGEVTLHNVSTPIPVYTIDDSTTSSS
ncbi:MAG: DUF427 domain-containing protein [Rhizobiaceae bacterium]